MIYLHFIMLFLYTGILLAQPLKQVDNEAEPQSTTAYKDSVDEYDESEECEIYDEPFDLEPPAEESIFTLLDAPQQYLSSSVSGFAKGIDEFFSDEKVLYDTNASTIRFTNDMVFSEGGGLGYVGDTSVKISLPNMQKKLKLVFENDVKDNRDNIDRSLESNLVDATQQQSYFAGLEMIWGEFENWKLRPGLGLKVGSKLEYFLRLRASRKYEISDKWSAYWSNTAYRYSETGDRFDVSLELNRRIYNDFLFRSSLFSKWEESNAYWDLSQIFSLTQSLGDKRALIYQLGVFGQSEPSIYANNYLAQIRYRKRIHSNYLFMELIPKVVHLKANKFRPDSSFTIRIEIVFKG